MQTPKLPIKFDILSWEIDLQFYLHQLVFLH